MFFVRIGIFAIRRFETGFAFQFQQRRGLLQHAAHFLLFVTKGLNPDCGIVDF
jgi:hypothetical protein